MKNDPKVVFKEEIKACGNYKYSQSTKVSSLGRTIIYAILGLVWAVSYSPQTGFMIESLILSIAFFCALFYLLIDITHYFVDTIGFHSLSNHLQRGKGSTESVRAYYKRQSQIISKVSFRFLVSKFVLLVAISILFIIGMLQEIW